MTLSSLSIYVVFMDPYLGNKGVMPFSLPTSKAYVEFIALHHNTKISDGRSDAKSGYSDRRSVAKKL